MGPLTAQFDGGTFDRERDADRLRGQLDRVKGLMLDGHWRQLSEIARAVRGSEAGVSARLRDMRKSRFGGFIVERRYVRGGLHEYRVIRSTPVNLPAPDQGLLFGPTSHTPECVR